MSTVLRRGSGRTFKYWNSNRWWGDQGGTSQCVVYTAAHMVERPNNRTTPWQSQGGHALKWNGWRFDGQEPLINLDDAYNWAQLNDEWPGTDYDGTSVRAGMKYLQRQGLITGYHWAYDNNTIINALLYNGPVSVGTMWTMDMFITNSRGFTRPTGEDAGGHAYLLDGVNTRHKFYRFKNSWGRNWGRYGHGYITFDDFDILLKNWGEAAIVTRT